MEQTKKIAIDLAQSKDAVPFVFEANGIPFLAVPDGYNVSNKESLLERPREDSRRVELADPQSVIKYLGRHGTATTAVYIRSAWMCDDQDILAECVIDDGKTGQTSWRSHTLFLRPCPTREFRDWRRLDGKDISQIDLCLFLDKHLSQIVRPEGTKSPTAAEVMTFAANLQDVKKVEFKKSVNLDNGRVQLLYNEDGAAGHVDIPREFFIKVRPLIGRTDTYMLKVRLRYRIVDATRLVFTVDLLGLDDLIEQIRADLTNDVVQGLKAAGEENWPVYIKA